MISRSAIVAVCVASIFLLVSTYNLGVVNGRSEAWVEAYAILRKSLGAESADSIGYLYDARKPIMETFAIPDSLKTDPIMERSPMDTMTIMESLYCRDTSGSEAGK